MPQARESKSKSKDQAQVPAAAKPAAKTGIAGLQRSIGNQATVGLLSREGGFDADRHLPGESGLNGPELVGYLRSAGASEGGAPRGAARSATATISRTAISSAPVSISRWPWSKTKPTEPQITPEMARDIQNAIAKSPEMKRAEEIRAEGTDDAEDRALREIESFWDTGVVEIKGDKVKLAQFKPLMFTPSERRVRQINKIRGASNVRKGFDSAVDQGRIDPTKTATPLKQAPGQQPTPPTGGSATAPKAPSTPSAVPGVVGTVGDAGQKVSKGSDAGANIGQYFQDPTQGAGMSEGAKLLDTKYNNPSDPMYGGPPSMESKSDWADGVISAVQGAFSLVSSVADILKAKDAREGAEAGTGLAANVASTAGTLTQMVENIEGAHVTTNLFHWVPGLSVISNAFSAVKSAISLAPKAVQLDSLRKNGAKVKDDKQREDVQLAVSRLAVRSAQQVENDSFSIAKSLTNAGLSLAEVVTAGGFGIPRLASAVMSGVGVLHSIGHAIADFIRANATGKARTEYFGAHKSGAAEKLLNTDPEFAADAILSRATEGDAQALAILAAFGIKVPAVGGAKLVKMIQVQNGKNKEQQIEYDFEAIQQYDTAKAKLIDAIKPEKSVGETVDQVASLLTERTQGLAAAKRLAEVRNELKMKGKSDRGTGASVRGFFKGKSGLQKSIDKTEKFIRDDKTKTAEEKEALINRLKGITPPAQGPDGNVSMPYDMKTLNKAMTLPYRKLATILKAGPEPHGGKGPVWEAYVVAYAQKASQKV